MAVSLRPSKAPNLLVAPVDYDQRYQDQFSNALRLYFNQIDNFTGFVAQPISGTIAERPAVNLHIGQMYFDTSPGLDIPLWWNGTDWVDATGIVRVPVFVSVTSVKAVGRIGTVTVTTV
jgi:hypothetical protein